MDKGRGLLFGAMLGGMAACGGQGGPPTSIAIGDLCTSIVSAACDRFMRCGTAPQDRPTCISQVTAAFDECPFFVDAVAMGEATYDGAAAVAYVEAFRTGACTDLQPDPVAMGVFTPKRASGEVCHSKVSCQPPLVCDGHTTSTPAGTCVAAAN